MESARDFADRLDEAAATLHVAARDVAAAGPVHPAFGVDGAGRLAEIGYELHEQWASTLAARAREAAVAAAHLTDAAAALRQAVAGYADSDAAAARRQPVGEP